MFWICPLCGNEVKFEEQVKQLFDEIGEAEFDPESGLYFHTIICDGCDSNWTMTISGRNK